MRPRSAILIAAALLFVISNWIPFGREALYPLTLFTTWVHEMGHGLTALVLGGQFDHLEIFRNAGGLAYTYARPGWPEALVSAGGLLAPPLVGALILAIVHGPRRARICLAFLAAALVASMAVYVRTPVGIIAMAAVALVLGYAAWRADPEHRVILAQFLAVVLALDTVTRMIGYAFMSHVQLNGSNDRTDAGNIADNLGGPIFVWGIVITVLALAMLGAGAWFAWRRPARPAAPARTAR
jgi:hypothetical protein